ncbi:MAG: hypothetical protein ISS36_03445 [Candidatus Aenigmarchaeota archaeon]|nr:hypothetical protein [Candidatus Aenigmarchaeota archaeon]
MGYRHQTPNLKQPLRKEEIEYHTKLLRNAFSYWQSTGYWQPEGEDWRKETTRHRYLVYPVDDKFGLAVERGTEPKKYFNQRMATVYPSLGVAVLGDSRTLDRAENGFLTRLSRMGYRIAEKRCKRRLSNSCKTRVLEPKPFHVAIEETDHFRTEQIFEQVVDNVDAILGGRESIYDATSCEIVVYDPPGDRINRSSVGLTADEIRYGHFRNNFVSKHEVPVFQGRVNREKLGEIFFKMEPDITMGVSSRRLHPEQEYQTDWSDRWKFNLHAPMIDFRCSDPEEAIKVMEELQRDPRFGFDRRNAVLIDSGASFHLHFPGNMMPWEFAERYLETLENHDEVCGRWPELQRDQEYELLRVAPAIQKPKIPVTLDL